MRLVSNASEKADTAGSRFSCQNIHLYLSGLSMKKNKKSSGKNAIKQASDDS